MSSVTVGLSVDDFVIRKLTFQKVEREGPSEEQLDKTSRGDTECRVFCWVETQKTKAKH